MTAGQFAYTLPGNRGVKAWFHACPFETNFEHQSVAFNQLDSAEYSRVFQVISSLSSDVFERAYVITTDIALDTNWEDHNVRSSRKEKIRGIIERLSKPSKIRSIFGPGLTEHAKKYGAPMDLADAVALDRRVDAKYAAREKARKSKNPGNRRA